MSTLEDIEFDQGMSIPEGIEVDKGMSTPMVMR